jgi:hypothetical protein
MKTLEFERATNPIPNVDEDIKASARKSVAKITASLPVVPHVPTIDWDGLERENGTGKHMLRMLLRTPLPDFTKSEPELVTTEDREEKLPVDVDDFIWADLVSRATAPDRPSRTKKDDLENKQSSVQKPDIREIEALFGLPSYDPASDRVIKIADDESDPRNEGLSINQTTLDIPLQWKEFIGEVDSRTHSEKIKDGLLPPARERIKTTFAAVLAHLKEGMQPEFMPGVEAEAILQYPEPLSDKEVQILLANPNKQFVSLFLTLCLTMQNPDAPILKPINKAAPVNPPSGQVFEPANTSQPTAITMSELVARANAATVIARTVEEVQRQDAEKEAREIVSMEEKTDKEKIQLMIAQELKKHDLLTADILAYSWATAQHETAGAWMPVVEGFFEDERLGLPLGTTGRREAVKRGYSGGAEQFGRGIVMLTHDYNYRWMSEMLGIDLVNNPDLMLDPEISVRSLIVWEMKRKDGNGKTVIDYVNEGDYVGARRPVNGSDRARDIAKIADSFLPEAREMVKALG